METKQHPEAIAEPLNNEVSDSFFFHVHRMKKAIFRTTNRLMAEAGISLQPEQLPILIILRKMGVLSQRQLSDITLRDKSSILRSISALQQKGLLTVEQDSIDKRKNNISLSAEGKKLAHTLKELLTSAEEEVLSVFTDEERAIAHQNVKSYADKLEPIIRHQA